jgi:hypothetical protein
MVGGETEFNSFNDTTLTLGKKILGRTVTQTQRSCSRLYLPNLASHCCQTVLRNLSVLVVGALSHFLRICSSFRVNDLHNVRFSIHTAWCISLLKTLRNFLPGRILFTKNSINSGRPSP